MIQKTYQVKRSKSSLLISGAIATAFSLSAMTMAKADDLSDLKAQMQMLNKKISDLEAKSVAPAAEPAPKPSPFAATRNSSGFVPESLLSDQEGRAINDQNPVGLTIFDNNKTTLKIYGLVEATLADIGEQQVSGIPYGRGSLGNTPYTAYSGSAPAGSYRGTLGFQTSWFSGNRLGFDIGHDMGNSFGLTNLKAIAKLETEFELPSGAFDTSNTLFNRDAWFGFYSPDLGKLTFGRQNTLTRDFTQSWGDPYGSAAVTYKEGGFTNVNNFKQLIWYSGGGAGTRMDSSVVWKKELDGHVIVGLAHSFGFQGAGGSGGLGAGQLYGTITPGYTQGGQGGPVPGDPRNSATNEASIGYNSYNFGNGVIGNINYSYNQVNIDDLNQVSNQVGGSLLFGDKYRLNAGLIGYTAQQGLNASVADRHDRAWTISGNVRVDKTDYSLGYQSISVNDAGFIAGGTGHINMLPFISLTANLSMLNAISSNLASGHKNTLYGSVMYHYDKQIDMYVAFDYTRADGGTSQIDPQNNGTNNSGNPALGVPTQTELAAGIRFKF